MSHDLMALPELPVPEDDGAADHLPGMPVPSVALPATDGRTLTLDVPAGADRLVVYAYPRTGRPGEPSLTEDWDAIPGARGCTPESCGFRDHAAELAAATVCADQVAHGLLKILLEGAAGTPRDQSECLVRPCL